jgi:hypothetical protein
MFELTCRTVLASASGAEFEAFALGCGLSTRLWCKCRSHMLECGLTTGLRRMCRSHMLEHAVFPVRARAMVSILEAHTCLWLVVRFHLMRLLVILIWLVRWFPMTIPARVTMPAVAPFEMPTFSDLFYSFRQLLLPRRRVSSFGN